MATIRYYTINGSILGEETIGGSGFRAYGSEGLGSVAVTYSGGGLLENTYHHKPYGTQVSKTGVATDPAFRWVGTVGYRQTGANYSEVYIRSRHLSSFLGQWSTLDVEFPNSQPYQYANGSPATFVDQSGDSPGKSGGSKPPKWKEVGCLCNPGRPAAPKTDPHYKCYQAACASYCTQIERIENFLNKSCSSITNCSGANTLWDPCDPASSDYIDCHGPGDGGGNGRGQVGGTGCCMECLQRVCCNFTNRLRRAAQLDLRLAVRRCQGWRL